MFDRYRLKGLLKRGGTSEILEAVMLGDAGFERRVAIKRLLPEFGREESVRAGFFDEGRILSQLNHPSLVQILDFGLVDGQPFQVLELVDGLSLLELGAFLESQHQRMPAELLAYVGGELCRALGYVHRARDAKGRALGIVHRDVNPRNVLMSFDGGVKLIDFGVAFAREREARTRVGATKGTLAYMSPEQAKGSGVDGRTDLFALACTLHWLAAGKSPLELEAVRLKVFAGASCEIDPQLPASLADVIAKALSFRREDRFLDAEAMGQAFWSSTNARAEHMRDWLPHFEKSRSGEEHPMLELFDDALFELQSQSGEEVRRFASIVKDVDLPTELIAAPGLLPDATQRTVRSEPVAKEELAVILGNTTPEVSRNFESETDEALEPSVGALIHGYRLIEQIGAGGNARVYRARHQTLEYEAAIKVLRRQKLNNTALRRIQREARMLAKLSHPNIVKVRDHGLIAGIYPFITMELVKGRTLTDLLREEKRLPLERAVPILRQVALGLAEAHRHDLVHRDLKPANVMISDEHGGPMVKILDFGIVRIPDRETALTRNHQILGTPAFIAPEQLLSPSTVGPEADLYALGGLAYSLLSGRPPFLGDVAAIAEKHLSARPEALPELGPLTDLVLALLEKEPHKRPQIEQVLEVLGAFMEPTEAVRISLPPTEIRTTASSDKSWIKFGAIAALVVLCALFAGMVVGAYGLRPQTVPSANVPTTELPHPTDNPAVGSVGAISAQEPTRDVPLPLEPEKASELPREELLGRSRVRPKESAVKKRAVPAALDSGATLLRQQRMRIENRANELGLSDDDLATGTLAPLFSRWRTANQSADLPGATLAADGLLAELDHFVVDRAFLKKRLGRLLDRLEDGKAQLEPERLSALESRCFQLRDALRPGLAPREYTALSRRLLELESQIRQLPRASPAGSKP